MGLAEIGAARLSRMCHLARLESEAIHILREAVVTHRPVKPRAANDGGSLEQKKREGYF